jgi:hypothetical protein
MRNGSTDVYFGPKPPGAGKNWIAMVPDKGFFVILRLYGPPKRISTRLGSRTTSYRFNMDR